MIGFWCDPLGDFWLEELCGAPMPCQQSISLPAMVLWGQQVSTDCSTPTACGPNGLLNIRQMSYHLCRAEGVVLQMPVPFGACRLGVGLFITVRLCGVSSVL